MDLRESIPEGWRTRSPGRERASRDRVAHRREPTIREGIRLAGLLARGNVRRDVRVVQAGGVRPRSIPVLRARPPRFLGLHADAGPSRGRRTSDDAAGAAPPPGTCLPETQRNPFPAAPPA